MANIQLIRDALAEDAGAYAASIIAHANDAIITKTLDGTVLSWNAAAEKIFGYSANEMIGRSIGGLFPADRLHEEAELVAQVQAGGEISHFESRRLRKDGALIDVSVTLSTLRDRHGQIVAVSKIARDITEHKRAQSGARLAAELKAGLDQSSMRISLWGADERNLYANGPYAAEWGLTPAQLLGVHFAEVLDPAAYARAQPYADAARAGQPQLFQRQVVPAAGALRHELVNLIPGPGDSEGRGFFIVITDITCQVQAEQAAAEAAARYQRLYEDTPAMVHASAPDGRVLSVSNTWLKKLGYTRDEVLARHVPDFLTPESREVRRMARLALAESGVCENVALEAVCKSGQVMNVLMSAIFERDRDGQVLRVLTVLQDVTDRLRAERALAKSEALLNRTGAMADVGGWEMDIASQTITWSEQTRRIHGVPADYVPVLASAIDFYAPEARDVIQTAVGRAMATGEPWDLELPFIRANGDRIWVRAVGTAEFEGGRVARLLGAFQDISVRKQLTLDLAEQQRFLRRVMDVSPQGMFTTDLAGRCTYVNAAWQALTGLSLAQALNTDLRQPIHPDDLASVLARQQAALDGGASRPVNTATFVPTAAASGSVAASRCCSPTGPPMVSSARSRT
jgi:PAS domain S-box-containing protein